MIRDGRAIPRPHHTGIKSHQERSQGTKEKQENERESCVRALDSHSYVHVLVTSPWTHIIITGKAKELAYTATGELMPTYFPFHANALHVGYTPIYRTECEEVGFTAFRLLNSDLTMTKVWVFMKE